MDTLEELKYPIGKVKFPETITNNHIYNWVKTIEEFPFQVENELKSIQPNELLFAYRPEGWNIKQLVNHCVDSLMNSIIRFKLALPEDCPIIKPYEEANWAELSDTNSYNVSESLQLLKSLHQRWVFLLKTMSEEDFKKCFIHPDGKEIITLEKNLCIYEWHCNHHLQHIKNAKKFQY